MATDASGEPTADDFTEARHDQVSGSVLIVGVGAVGGALAWQLARLGICLRLIDKGLLGPTNLVWHEADAADVGLPKDVALADHIRERIPGSEVIGFAIDFTHLDADVRDDHLAWADVVVAATDDAQVQGFVNRDCLETAAPAVFPGVWVDPAGESEAGEIFWSDLRYGSMPCYDCLTQRRNLAGDAQPGNRGGDINVEALVSYTAIVVQELLNPLDSAATFLQRGRSLIRVRGNEPLRPSLTNDFPNGELVSHAAVGLPPQPCPACGQSAPSAASPSSPPPSEPFPEPATRPGQPGFTQTTPLRPRSTTLYQPAPSRHRPILVAVLILAPILTVVGLCWYILNSSATSGAASPQPTAISDILWTAPAATVTINPVTGTALDMAGLSSGVITEMFNTEHTATVRALDPATGNVLRQTIPGKDSPSTGHRRPSSDPIIGGDAYTVFALNPMGGSLQWKISWPEDSKGFGPVEADGVVAIIGINDDVSAYKATSGKRLWTQTVDSSAADVLTDLGMTSATVFVLTEFHLYAYDANNGKLKWGAVVTPTNGASFAQQLGGAARGRIIVTGNSWVEALSVATGHVLWRHAFQGDGTLLWPLVSSQLTIVHVCTAGIPMCGSGQELAFDPVTGRELWSWSSGAGNWTSSEPPPEWLGAGVLLRWNQYTDGIITLMNPRTGNQLSTWQSSSSSPAFVAADAGRLYIVNDDSSAFAIKRPARSTTRPTHTAVPRTSKPSSHTAGKPSPRRSSVGRVAAHTPPPPASGPVPPSTDPGQTPIPSGSIVLGSVNLAKYCKALSPDSYAILRFPYT